MLNTDSWTDFLPLWVLTNLHVAGHSWQVTTFASTAKNKHITWILMMSDKNGRYTTCYMGNSTFYWGVLAFYCLLWQYCTIINSEVLSWRHQVTPPQLMGFEREAMEYQKLETERCYCRHFCFSASETTPNLYQENETGSSTICLAFIMHGV